MRRVFVLLSLLAISAFTGRALAQDATPAPQAPEEFEIAPGVVAFDAVFAEGQEAPVTYRLRFDAGVTYAFTPAPSLDLVYVESGTLTLRLDTAITVTRSDGTSETVAPGTEVTVTQGDYFVFPPMITGEVRNDSPEAAVVSVAGIIPGSVEMATPSAGTPIA